MFNELMQDTFAYNTIPDGGNQIICGLIESVVGFNVSTNEPLTLDITLIDNPDSQKDLRLPPGFLWLNDKLYHLKGLLNCNGEQPTSSYPSISGSTINYPIGPLKWELELEVSDIYKTEEEAAPAIMQAKLEASW